MSTPLRIGRLAELSGLTPDTIRFYERLGLITPPRRSTAGYRLYDPDALDRLRAIQRGKELGFTLNELAELFKLQDHPDACAEIGRLATAKIAEAEQRIHRLERARIELSRLVGRCTGPRDVCPLYDVLHDTAGTPCVELVYDPHGNYIDAVRSTLADACRHAGHRGGWEEWSLDDPAAPRYARSLGAPAFLIDGHDLLPAIPLPTGRCCRLYPHPTGDLQPLPDLQTLIDALEPYLRR
ncbi:heavy metal-responsive transcriptional regulator [Endothiovibrio diazotrophicus]